MFGPRPGSRSKKVQVARCVQHSLDQDIVILVREEDQMVTMDGDADFGPEFLSQSISPRVGSDSARVLLQFRYVGSRPPGIVLRNVIKNLLEIGAGGFRIVRLLHD